MAPTETPVLEIAGLAVYERELDWQALRAQGSGGQNLHKTESAVQLRYDIGVTPPGTPKFRLFEGAFIINEGVTL